ncbi:MAG: flagellar export protein FliJ [Halioglobus sp.]
MKQNKMEKVAAVAKVVEQQLAVDLGHSVQSHAGKRDQLDQLMQFKSDYEEMLAEKSKAGISAIALQDYRLFLSKLDQAISQQTQEVQSAEQNLAQVRAQWIDKSQRKSALEHLVDERRSERLRLREKNEQKETDERSMHRLEDPST